MELVFIFSLQKASRLKKTAEFHAVFHEGKAESGKVFQVMVKPRLQATTRLGMAVNKGTIPRAIDRSYVKRLIREEFRMRKHCLASMDIVVRVLRKVPRSQAGKARIELAVLFSRVSRWAA